MRLGEEPDARASGRETRSAVRSIPQTDRLRGRRGHGGWRRHESRSRRFPGVKLGSRTRRVVPAGHRRGEFQELRRHM